MKERCGVCKFYDKDRETINGIMDDNPLHEDDYEGECRRYPPVLIDRNLFSAFDTQIVICDAFSGPTVNTLYWCGEFKPAEGEAAKKRP